MFNLIRYARRRRVAIVVSALLAGTAIGGITAVAATQRVHVGAHANHSIASADVTGGTPEQQQLVRGIVAGLTAAPVQAVTISAPPDGFTANAELGEFGDTWLTILVAAPSLVDGGAVTPEWTAQLLAGAFRDGSFLRHLPTVLGDTVDLALPNGTIVSDGSGVIAQPLGQGLDQTDAQTLGQRIQKRVDALTGLISATVTSQSPLDIAPVVTEVTGDGTSFLNSNGPSLLRQTFGDINRLEGVLVRVEDANGQLLRISGYTARTGLGVTWSAPGLPTEGPTG